MDVVTVFEANLSSTSSANKTLITVRLIRSEEIANNGVFLNTK